MQLTLSAGNAREAMTTCRQFSDRLYEIVARFHGCKYCFVKDTMYFVARSDNVSSVALII